MEAVYNGEKLISKFEKGDLVGIVYKDYYPSLLIMRVLSVRFSLIDNQPVYKYDVKTESYVGLYEKNYFLNKDFKNPKELGPNFSVFSTYEEDELSSIEDEIYSLVEELEKKKEFLSKLSESLSQQEMEKNDG